MTTTHSTASLEYSVLGGILCRNHVIDLLELEETDFVDEKCRLVWAAMKQLRADDRPIDIVTVEGILEGIGKFALIGGHAFLVELAMGNPTPDNVVDHSNEIRDRALGRKALLAISGVLAKHRDVFAASGAEVLDETFEALGGLERRDDDGTITVSQLIRGRLAELEKVFNGTATARGYPTGIAKLDEVTGGWQPGIVSLICARPAMGKSSAAIATTAACNAAGVGVHVFSLEDTRSSYADRLLAGASRVPAEQIRSGNLLTGSFRDFSASATKLEASKKWLINDLSRMSAEEIVRSVLRHRKANDTKVVIVDYISLLRWPKAAKSMHDAISENITTLADAAKKHDMAFVVLSQLNREVEKRPDKRPQMSDLRESGSLEERAKCVVGLYRGSYYSPTGTEGVDYPKNGASLNAADFAKQVTFLVLKNSNGRTGQIQANFDGPTMRMW